VKPTGAMQQVRQRPVSRPALFRVLSLAVIVSAFAFFIIALFGFVIFINAWNRWHRYEGQPFHRADFEVGQAYFQRGNRGAVFLYASGTVEGQKEWMNLEPYVQTRIRSQAELDDQVPAGISIPIYVFPEMQGRARVQAIADLPPAEASKQQALKTARQGLLGLLILGLVMFLLVRVRGLCFAEAPPGLTATP
jgi:hypothetical protein